MMAVVGWQTGYDSMCRAVHKLFTFVVVIFTLLPSAVIHVTHLLTYLKSTVHWYAE